MTDVPTGAAPEGVSAPVPAPTGEVSEADAVSFLAKRREAPQPAPQSEEAPPPAADRITESGDEPDAAPPQEPSGENEATDDPAGEPPIDPPRSWTKADKEVFATLPRATQERLVELDRARELEVRKGQNEVADKTKAAEAREQAAEQARQQYEAALPNVLALAQSDYQREFSDIKTQADVQYIADTDPQRYIRWHAAAENLRSVQYEQQAVQQRQQEEAVNSFKAYVEKETSLFLEKAPDYVDAEKGAKLRAQAKETLHEIGFSPAELKAAIDGQTFSFHDHRVQLLIEKARRYDVAQKQLKSPSPKPAQPTQRPGVAASKGEQRATEVDALRNKLVKSGSDADAVALLRARRRA